MVASSCCCSALVLQKSTFMLTCHGHDTVPCLPNVLLAVHHVVVIVLHELHWCRADDVVQAPVADIVFILKSLMVKILHFCSN
jgi:hypothetical protein